MENHNFLDYVKLFKPNKINWNEKEKKTYFQANRNFWIIFICTTNELILNVCKSKIFSRMWEVYFSIILLWSNSTGPRAKMFYWPVRKISISRLSYLSSNALTGVALLYIWAVANWRSWKIKFLLEDVSGKLKIRAKNWIFQWHSSLGFNTSISTPIRILYDVQRQKYTVGLPSLEPKYIRKSQNKLFSCWQLNSLA